MTVSKLLSPRINKIDWFIRVYDGTRYLVLFGSEKNDSISKSFRYHIGVKSSLTKVISHNYPKIKLESQLFLAIENNHDPIIVNKSDLEWK